MKRMHLYIDDSGTRRPDRNSGEPRADGMDYFALGGILVHEEEIGVLVEAHRALLGRWGLDAPLHSTKIRGRRGSFAWLGEDEKKEADFLADLEQMLLALPVFGIACVIDRPGYVARYADKHQQPWLLCKTAFAILVERAAKYAKSCDARLEIYFEQAGKHEDRAIQNYAKALEVEGMPFDSNSSGAYQAFQSEDFKAIMLGQPKRVTKKVAMIQVADMLLYPLVKGGYDPKYEPYVRLFAAGRVIDTKFPAEARPYLGVKYSCFDRKK